MAEEKCVEHIESSPINKEEECIESSIKEEECYTYVCQSNTCLNKKLCYIAKK